MLCDYFSDTWAMNGEIELWLFADGSYAWRQSLFYDYSPGGIAGWYNQEQGKWSESDGKITLHKTWELIANRDMARLYFERYREFAIERTGRGHRMLVSYAGKDLLVLHLAVDVNHQDPRLKEGKPNNPSEVTPGKRPRTGPGQSAGAPQR